MRQCKCVVRTKRGYKFCGKPVEHLEGAEAALPLERHVMCADCTAAWRFQAQMDSAIAYNKQQAAYAAKPVTRLARPEVEKQLFVQSMREVRKW